MGACTHKGLWLVDKTFAEQMEHEADFMSASDRFHSHTLLSQLTMYSVTSFGWFCLFVFQESLDSCLGCLVYLAFVLQTFDTLRF